MKTVRIVGTGATPVGRLGKSATVLASEALDLALADAGMQRGDLHSLVAVPSLSNPHFMQAHYLATKMGLLPSKRMIVRTLDTGGAGPISALTAGKMLIAGTEWASTVAIVASDAVKTLNNKEFLKRADGSVEGSGLESPRIPNGYDRIAQWHLEKYNLKREHLAMVTVLMSANAARHPDALCREAYSLDEVLSAPMIGKVTSILECARRADGAAAVILSSETHFKRHFSKDLKECPVVIATGEGSGPLYPPKDISEELFSCERACRYAYRQAQLGPRDIEFFGLYDCFPICFIRAVSAVGLCPVEEMGKWIEEKYDLYKSQNNSLTPAQFPMNLHGGLQCFGAPWEVPAMYNVLEAVKQLNGTAGKERQIEGKPRRALVYGNGGIFSASSVAILGDGTY